MLTTCLTAYSAVFVQSYLIWNAVERGIRFSQSTQSLGSDQAQHSGKLSLAVPRKTWSESSLLRRSFRRSRLPRWRQRRLSADRCQARHPDAARIEAQAADTGVRLRREVFTTRESWQDSVVNALHTVSELAKELGIEKHLRLWPDKSLGSQSLTDWMPNPGKNRRRLPYGWHRITTNTSHLKLPHSSSQTPPPSVPSYSQWRKCDRACRTHRGWRTRWQAWARGRRE